jgi:hypothetical protein
MQSFHLGTTTSWHENDYYSVLYCGQYCCAMFYCEQYCLLLYFTVNCTACYCEQYRLLLYFTVNNNALYCALYELYCLVLRLTVKYTALHYVLL